ncbi:beta-ketoacyl-ACP synthase III [Bombilactobacillus thymidiniphilus]|uniref:Beta-ketoacyl-[acyl-carrier-protein] synthase III n=1 Tax=Bombilactobacillus thymidiniphilus TaxID=2923363 RepID=A0ABY4PER1_9LACO|nr:beta-ketoacyl-ACP synthase III [Bombilactobacillus thymidiniphilus]UQS84230.1 ketoacyl-ACP synthase III [Bombilactobacillus thymidiniphilus]
MGLKIVRTAHYVPEKIVTNNDLTAFMETSDEWISSRTGIKERHIAQKQQTSDLGLAVGQQLLQQADWSPQDLDFIIVATMSPDYLTPSTAAIIQGKLQATNAFAFDINAACSGFIYALSVADKILNTKVRRGMIIGAETLSKLVDWHERSTAVLFGDGAGGVLVEHDDQEQSAVIAEDLQTFGSDGQSLTAGYQPMNSLFNNDSVDSHAHYFEMDGRAVYRFATHEVPSSIMRTLQQAKWEPGEVDWFVLHQANLRIIKSIARHLQQPETKFLTNVAHFGNTSAASVPILLDEAVNNQQIDRGQKLILSGFGGGLTAGSIALIY